MRLLDLTLPSAAENLALDESLLLEAESAAGGEVLRLWENPEHAVVLGAGGSVAIDVDRDACEADGIPILRRSSGGGTVLLGPGCLCFSLVLAYESSPGFEQIRLSNRLVLGRVVHALRDIAPGAAIEGISDLALEAVGRRLKFSGNSQQRKQRFFLHHGTILAGFDLARIGRYLAKPERQPDYRAERTHAEFVTNLPATRDVLKDRLIREWQPTEEYAPVPLALVRRLLEEKYSRDEWNLRR
jgi:lipoate-protein ligase A